MGRLVVMFVASLLFVSTARENKFKGLPVVETYEIRPGIQMMPTYSDNGEVCRIALEKRHVSWKEVDLDAEMSPEEIYRIFDELAPKMERGRPKLKLGGDSTYSMVDGGTLETFAIYENVSIRMYGKSKGEDPKRYVAATIDWEKRKCKNTPRER